MALFFFHFYQGAVRSDDDLGLEFPNVETAYLQAVEAARNMWPELLRDRKNPLECAFEISSAAGETLLRFDFAELLERLDNPSGDPAPLLTIVAEDIIATHARVVKARKDVMATLALTKQSLEESGRLLSEIHVYRPAAGSALDPATLQTPKAE